MYLLMKQKNVIYPYHYEDGQTTALFMAHTDTVFPDMEPMGVREEEDKMFFPQELEMTLQMWQFC